MPSRRPRTPGLPVALTPLLGRRRELAETLALLEKSRLLTVTGAGGSGKTRLALEIAQGLRGQFAEVVWVDLAPVTDPELVAQRVLDSMNATELAAEDVLQVILDTVRDHRFLFVLDNCEHVVAGAAFVAEELLRSCENATILATSREPLGIAGEQTWSVPPLSLPDAMLLFETRARAVAASFQSDAAVEEICRRLEGIPLAIELAAARANVLSTQEIAHRLDDAFRVLSGGSRTQPRHRTIHETIDWSHRLLSPDEQRVFRRLAIFASRFSLAAAEAAGGADADVLTNLTALAAKSLVLVEEGRYRLLDTVRQFAAEKLDEAGERELVRDRYARYHLELVEALEPRLFAAGDAAAIAIVDDEIANIRAVFDSGPPADLELRLVYALHWYWFARGHFHEARRRVTAALLRAAEAEPAVRARARIAAATVAMWQAEWSSIRPAIDEAIEALRPAADARALAVALLLRGAAEAFAANDMAAAAASFEEALRHANGIVRALILYWTGIVAQLRDDLAGSRTALEQALQAGATSGSKAALAHPLTALGHTALRQGRRSDAVRHFRDALELHAEIDDRWGLTQAVEGIGLALLDEGEAEEGTRLLAAASAWWLHLGARPWRGAALEDEKNARIREALTSDRLRVVLASGAAMSYDAMVGLARERGSQLGTAKHPALEVRALGPLQVFRDGAPLDESARARELLLFLLCHPSGRTKDQIGAALWPDAEPAKLRNNFHVTMHRLRKSLGAAEWIVIDGDTYALDRARGVRFDAEVFEREATAAVRARDEARLAPALDLYRGDFFENAGTGEWHDEMRERLRALYARGLETLGRMRGAAGNHEGAAEVYQKLVGLDDLDEDAAGKLIDALARSGDVAGARRVWRRLADALKRELGEKPSIKAP
jgi:predicted ATPase/DNA-binding SARP family transcriptional activator/HPt (histidine-containing phosphotransfer) domain-containing protein